MSEYLISIKIGEKKYHISHSGETVYYSSSSKTGGTTLKGIKFKNNQLINTSTNKEATEFNIAQAIEKSKKSSGCFISTIVYEAINGHDECNELMLLRSFRDNVMLEDDVYAKLVHEYYEIAPDIAEKLKQKNDLIFCQYLADKFIKESIKYINIGEYQNAVQTYIKMVRYLQLNL